MSYRYENEPKISRFAQRRTPKIAMILLVALIVVVTMAYSNANKRTAATAIPSSVSARANLTDSYSSTVAIASKFSIDLKSCKNVECVNAAAAAALSDQAKIASYLAPSLYPDASFYTYGLYQGDIVSLQKFYLAVGQASTTSGVLARVAGWKQLLAKTKFDELALLGLLK